MQKVVPILADFEGIVVQGPCKGSLLHFSSKMTEGAHISTRKALSTSITESSDSGQASSVLGSIPMSPHLDTTLLPTCAITSTLLDLPHMAEVAWAPQALLC